MSFEIESLMIPRYWTSEGQRGSNDEPHNRGAEGGLGLHLHLAFETLKMPAKTVPSPQTFSSFALY